MDFYQHAFTFINETDYMNWNILSYLKYLKEHVMFTSDSKQEILDWLQRKQQRDWER